MAISYEEMFGAPAALATAKPTTGLPASAVSAEDMGFSSTAEETADEGFFRRSGRALYDWYTGAVNHPIDNVTGMAKGIAGGVVSMGRLAASGLAGLTTASLGKGFEAGPQAVEKFLEEDKKFSEGILYVNLAPKNKQDEAVQKFLGIIPDAIVSTGDTVYEKTGSALAGAGSQAMLTLLTLKPSIASKTLGGLKGLKEGTKQSPGATAGAEKVQATFEEMAKKDPEGAQAIIDHVTPADPELGALLKEAVEQAGKKAPEKTGEDAAKANSAPAEQVSFQTSKGSVYKVQSDGTTVRNKAERPEHPGDSGQKPKSNATYYVSAEDAIKLGEIQTQGGVKRSIERTSDNRIGVKYIEGKDAGKFEKRTVVSTHSAPAEGLVPVETWKDGSVHFGNKIVKVGNDSIASPQQIASDISKAVGELPDALSKPDTVMTPAERSLSHKNANELQAKQLLDEELKHLKHTADDTTGEHIIEGPGSELRAQENGSYLQIKRSDVASELQGKGVNQAMIARLVDEAGKRDLVASSDITVSKAAQRSYEALRKKGYQVKENPSIINETTGSKISRDPRIPVYEIRRGKSSWTKASLAPDPIVYMDHGHPVTHSSVVNAFRIGNATLEAIPGVRVIKGKLTEYYNQLIRTINPEALGPQAKTSASILAKHISIQMQRDSSFFHRAGERRSFWNNRAPEVPEFIKKFEKGEKFSDPLMQKAAEGYRRWNEDIYKSDQKLGIEYEAVDNYLYHLFENSEGAIAFLTRKYGKKFGDPSFTKDRVFELYDQAVAAGYKPKFTNPEDIMLARQHASDVAATKVNTLNELRSAGLAVEITAGSKAKPDFPAVEWRSPTGKRFYVHDSASAILDNAFNTQSLWSMPGIGGDAFRGAMALKNTIVPIKLALSLFHPLHVLTIDNATGMVRASKELLSGQKTPAAWMKDMAQATFYKGFIDSPRGGYRLLKAYQGKLADAELTPADTQALQYMAEGGFIPEMAAQYKTSAVSNLRSAIDRRSLAAAWHAPLAAISLLQKPMFEIWIPSLKIASYLKDVKTAVKVDPSLVENPVKRQLAFRRIAKSVDNRYGEMAYNTLFWNRWVKDLAVANTLSLGWQMGFIREYGGGMMDLGQMVTSKGSVVQKAKSGMLDRPLFVTFYTTQALAYGGLLTWALSGKQPDDFNDYIFPRSGELTEDGKEERLNTMFYPREFAAIYKHMENEGVLPGLGHLAENKASGVIGMTREWATGVNSFGREIRDPDAPAYKKLEQTLAYTLTELEPISIGAIRDSHSENPLKSAALNIAGFSPAPKYVTETKTEGLIRGTWRKYYSQKQTPFEKAEYSTDSRKLRKYYDAGDQEAYGELIEKMQEKYALTGAEQRRLEVNIARGSEPLFTMFERLTWQQQKKILDQMTEDEREAYLPHSNRQHLRNSYEPPESK